MQKYMNEARQLLALAIPVIVAQVAQTAMGFVDTVMAGGYSATDMAAVAIGTSIWLPAILFGHGLLLALTPVIAQLNGSGRRERIAHQVRQGFWLAGFVSLLIMRSMLLFFVLRRLILLRDSYIMCPEKEYFLWTKEWKIL